MEHEHYTYPEALKYLAKRYNIEIDEAEQTADEIQALNEKESLYILTAFAQKYYSDILLLFSVFFFLLSFSNTNNYF